VTVTWSARALSDVAGIYPYIAADSAEAAGRVVDRIFSAVEGLTRFPQMGRPSRAAGRRELVVDQNVVVYRVRRDEIWVVTVEHGARRR
jgi:plasmid stabilization system protein ParE